MTKQFSQYLNQIHKKLWEKSEEGEINTDKIKLTIRMTAGDTVVDKYFKAIKQLDKIEQVPNTDTWIVQKPEKQDIQITDSNLKTKTVRIPADVKEAGERYGISFSDLMTQAIIEEVSDLKDFVSNNLTGDLTEKETEYIFELMKKDVVEKKGKKKERAKRDRIRRKLYKKMFEETPDSDHIENLRQKSFQLRQTLR